MQRDKADEPGRAPALSVVVPMLDEEENVAPLVAELAEVLRGRIDYELVAVDDGSGDGTLASLRTAAAAHPELRVIAHPRRCGQSAALLSGVEAARAPLIATMDGDLQNDPRDIPALLSAFEAGGGTGTVGLVAGQRRVRRDDLLKRLSSRIANAVRARLLADGTRDTGCGLKLFPRAVFLRLPFFDGLHRFLPALVRREGLAVAHVDVGHRPRLAGATKYGLWRRAWLGLVDMLAVWWLIRRCRRPVGAREVRPEGAAEIQPEREE